MERGVAVVALALIAVTLAGCVGGTTGTASAGDPPVADIAASATIVKAGGNVTLDAGGSEDPDGGTLTFSWDLGDGTEATGPTVDHTYEEIGNYTVHLTVTDDEGRTATTTLEMDVPGSVYRQEVWFNWDSTTLDVLILGVEDPVVGAAIQEAIQAWRDGVADIAEPWLAENLTLRVYWPGTGGAPPSGFEPDIYFVPVGFFASQGPTDGTCTAHAPVGYIGPDPTDTEELYFTAAHEFGHCLGLSHIFEDEVEYEPAFDLLGGGSVHESWGKSCPSNLNARILERVFAGEQGDLRMAPWDYVQGEC